MNKTININLAGTFFHIDENAYGKLTRYLDAIRKSLQEGTSAEEIMKDIEARIAELFSEKIDHSKQVISLKELDEVIAIMGQPEDYAVDEEIFDDTPSSSKKDSKEYKQLFRDPDDKYIAGVSSGLGHYLGVDAIWLRLLWILLTIFSSGIFVLIYILMWILVPEAMTVAEKLKMKGKPINISTIEKKFREGFDDVSQKVKSADYSKIKSGSESFFSSLGKLVAGLLEVFVKLIGVLLLFIAASSLIALIVGLLTAGFSDSLGVFNSVYLDADTTLIYPLWILLALVFLVIGIPLFYLFVFGLRILFKNLKSLGRTLNISLVSMWFLALLGLIAYSVLQAAEYSHEGSSINSRELNITTGDTLFLKINSNTFYEKEMSKKRGFAIKYDENNRKIIYSKNIRLIVKSSKDSLARLTIEKTAKGMEFLVAKNRAEKINYNYLINGNQLLLDGYFVTPSDSGYRNQEVEATLYLPEGSVLYADKNTRSYHLNTSYYGDLLDSGMENHYLNVESDMLKCLSCPNIEESVPSKIIQVNTNDKIDWEDENWQEKIKNTSSKETTSTTDSLITE